MALSMTGFGRGAFTDGFFSYRVEIRSVNHRYLDVSMRMPRSLSQFEDKLRKSVGEHLNRGKVDLAVFFESAGSAAVKVRLDQGLASGYHQALLELAKRFEMPSQLSLDHFVRLPDLFVVEQSDLEPETLWQGLKQALTMALNELSAMRLAEGDQLVNDLLQRLEIITGLISVVEERAEMVPDYHRQVLMKRLTDILGQPGVDEARVAQEIAIYADRCNITEELVRLKSHLEQLASAFRTQGALGRKADFILQEINREVNTIASKANDLAIAQAAIEIKAELEKTREQIQNLE